MVLTKDPASCANFLQVTVNHIHVEWTVDFASEKLSGFARLDLQVLDRVDHVDLDVRGLENIQLLAYDEQNIALDASYRLIAQQILAFGHCMRVEFGEQLEKGTKLSLHVTYCTASGNPLSGLQWLPKEQTADQLQPMVFSYCQEINARSIVPCMDTPAVKQTYSAKLSVPSDLVALMSALTDGNKIPDSKRVGYSTYSFRQKVPIPSYLIAFAVAKLERRELSDRCAVWAEGSIVDKAAYEFAEAGDRSLAAIIAHEIAHSWTGNLVTNANWEHMWINEGFTMFVERKILGRLFGENYRHFMALNGWTTQLIPAVFEQHTPDSPYTKLVQNHEGIDPKDAFSFVYYEKGHAFLFYLEQKLGKNELEDFLRSYIRDFAYKSVDTDTWLDYFKNYFKDRRQVLDSVDFNAWLYAPGMPPVTPDFDRTLAQKCSELCAIWCRATDDEVATLDNRDYLAFTPMQRVQFIGLLCDADQPLSHKKLQRMEHLYGLDRTKNCEILTFWIRACVRAHWEPIIARALEFLKTIGRLKLIRPVYRDMVNWDMTQPMVHKLFEENRAFMHPVTVMMVEKELGLR